LAKVNNLSESWWFKLDWPYVNFSQDAFFGWKKSYK